MAGNDFDIQDRMGLLHRAQEAGPWTIGGHPATVTGAGDPTHAEVMAQGCAVSVFITWGVLLRFLEDGTREVLPGWRLEPCSR